MCTLPLALAIRFLVYRLWGIKFFFSHQFINGFIFSCTVIRFNGFGITYIDSQIFRTKGFHGAGVGSDAAQRKGVLRSGSVDFPFHVCAVSDGSTDITCPPRVDALILSLSGRISLANKLT